MPDVRLEKMRMRIFVACLPALLALGCGNPLHRDPANVYPGSSAYDKRVETFKVTPSQAYKLAYEQARDDEQLQYLSRKPTVVVKRSYVFSVPLASGANLQGYHVNGDNGMVTFFKERKTIPQTNARN